MDLYLIRHAWAEERDANRWPTDFDRPLTIEGRKRFKKMCARLAVSDLRPSKIVTSPLVRCRQTAEILADALKDTTGATVDVHECEVLAPGGDFKSLLVWLEEHCRDANSIACAGHAPDLDHLCAALIGQEQSRIRFAKGAAAAIRFADSPELAAGELRWLVTAKVLGVE